MSSIYHGYQTKINYCHQYLKTAPVIYRSNNNAKTFMRINRAGRERMSATTSFGNLQGTVSEKYELKIHK